MLPAGTLFGHVLQKADTEDLLHSRTAQHAMMRA